MLKKVYPFIILIILLLFPVIILLAQEEGQVDISPSIIDEKAQAKDILKYKVKLKNNSERKMSLYALVNDIEENKGIIEYNGPSDLDKTRSLARWIKIKRGVVDLMPGEEKELKLEIDVNLNAVAGKYHAVIRFANGSNRPLAQESAARTNPPKLLINLEVTENVIEKAQVLSFASLKKIFFKPKPVFELIIKNIGNRSVRPTGSIFIYDRRDKQIDEIKLDDVLNTINPNKEKKINIKWDKWKNGKYRANLELEYGTKSVRDLFAVTDFWIMPLSWLIFFILFLLILVSALSFIIFKKTYKHHHKTNQHYFLANTQKDGDNEHIINLK